MNPLEELAIENVTVPYVPQELNSMPTDYLSNGRGKGRSRKPMRPWSVQLKELEFELFGGYVKRDEAKPEPAEGPVTGMTTEQAEAHLRSLGDGDVNVQSKRSGNQ